jgi:hypothetical protein
MASKPAMKSSAHYYVHARQQLEVQAAALQQQLREAGEVQQAKKDRMKVRCLSFISKPLLLSTVCISLGAAKSGGSFGSLQEQQQ